MIDEQIEKLEKEISDKSESLTNLKAKKLRLEEGQPQAVADVLHEGLCRMNHTDGCGYEYESWSNVTNTSAGSKVRWLSKARKVIDFAEENKVPVKTLTDLIIATSGY